MSHLYLYKKTVSAGSLCNKLAISYGIIELTCELHTHAAVCY